MEMYLWHKSPMITYALLPQLVDENLCERRMCPDDLYQMILHYPLMVVGNVDSHSFCTANIKMRNNMKHLLHRRCKNSAFIFNFKQKYVILRPKSKQQVLFIITSWKV